MDEQLLDWYKQMKEIDRQRFYLRQKKDRIFQKINSRKEQLYPDECGCYPDLYFPPEAYHCHRNAKNAPGDKPEASE